MEPFTAKVYPFTQKLLSIGINNINTGNGRKNVDLTLEVYKFSREDSSPVSTSYTKHSMIKLTENEIDDRKEERKESENSHKFKECDSNILDQSDTETVSCYTVPCPVFPELEAENFFSKSHARER